MNKMNDFDLDIKIAQKSIEGMETHSITIPITLTLKNKCKSVESPTTGMTSACCHKKESVEVNIMRRCV
ncbi:hypothetical protein [Eubacterium sp. F2]|uniref:hypothetical protein n=1 Tax=Eubacterium sp. F2 TaxID=3381348 RepID=UPI0039081FCE